MANFLFILNLFIWNVTPGALASPQQPLCLLKSCGGQLVQCGIEKECGSWLKCVISCGNDKIRCPSFCGFYHQSPRINKTSQCIFDSNCVELGFSNLGEYQSNNDSLQTLAELEGTYWFVANQPKDHIFDVPCQRFDLKPKDSNVLEVHYSVPLTYQKKERIRDANGIFTELTSGAIEVIYDNFVGYHEKWFVLFKTEHTLLIDVCIDDGKKCFDYGGIILSRQKLSNLSETELTALNGAIHQFHHTTLSLFHTTQNENCSNADAHL